MNADDFQYFYENELDESWGSALRNMGAGVALGLAARTSPLIAQDQPPPRMNRYRDAYPAALDMANADYQLEKYISTNDLFGVGQNLERVAFNYTKKNETLGSRVFQTHTLKYTITVASPKKGGKPIKIPKKVDCYKVYKVNNREHAIGMGFNLLKQPELVVNYCKSANKTGASYFIFDENEVPLEMKVKNVKNSARYVSTNSIDYVTRQYFTTIINKTQKEYEAAGGNWDTLPFPIKVVFIDWCYQHGNIKSSPSMIARAKEGNWVGVAKEITDSNTYDDTSKMRCARNAQIVMKWEQRNNRYFDVTRQYTQLKKDMAEHNVQPPKPGTPEYNQMMLGQKNYMANYSKSMRDADAAADKKAAEKAKMEQAEKNGKKG